MNNNTAVAEMEVPHNLAQIEAPFELDLMPGSSIKGTVKSIGGGEDTTWLVPPDKLRVIPGFNPRLETKAYLAKIRRYANSMKTEGYFPHKPMAGYVAEVDGENVIYIFEGHTRLRSVDLANSEGAGIEKIPVSIKQKTLSMNDMTFSLINANTDGALSPYEQAIVCARLEKNGVLVSEIARRTGLTTSWIENLFKLITAPLKLRELVAAEMVAATMAIEMITEHGGAKALLLIEAAMVRKSGGGGTTRVTKKDVNTTPNFKQAVAKSAPTMYAAIEQVTADPGYQRLTPEVRAVLDKIITELAQAKKPPEKDDRQADLVEEAGIAQAA